MRYFDYAAAGPLDPFRSSALRKLRLLSHLLRAVSAGYAGWVLWGILTGWLDAERIQRIFSKYLERDLSAMAASQRYGALAVDLMVWFLLFMAVAYCWNFLRCLTLANHLPEAARHLSRCAWFAIACEALAELTRPLQTFLLTLHLPATEQVWKWSFHNVHLLAVLFCVALLLFAYLFTWTMELAEENRSFV